MKVIIVGGGRRRRAARLRRLDEQAEIVLFGTRPLYFLLPTAAYLII